MQYIVVEEKGIRQYLESRNILKRYKKAKVSFQKGNILQVSLKKRQPRSFGEMQFKITGKYRAFGYFKEPHIFIVTEISDHQ